MPGPVTAWLIWALGVLALLPFAPTQPGEVARALLVGGLLLGSVIAYGCHAIAKAIKETSKR